MMHKKKEKKKKGIFGAMIQGTSPFMCAKFNYALFWKANAQMEWYPICCISWCVERTMKGFNVPRKVLCYFPLKDHHRRLYS